jgi:hypothetical protein
VSNPSDLNDIQDRVAQNAQSMTDMQSLVVATVQKLTKDTTFDKWYKVGQLIFPFVIIWLVYYVNAELNPVRIKAQNNSLLLKEAKLEREKLRSKQHAYDVTQARRDAIMERVTSDLHEIKELLKERNK